MNISVTPANAEFVEHLVESGRYHTVSEVFRDGLRLLERAEHQRLLEKWLLEGLTSEEEARLPKALLEKAKNHFRAKIQEGLDELDRGEKVNGPEFFAQWNTKLSKLAGSSEKRKA